MSGKGVAHVRRIILSKSQQCTTCAFSEPRSFSKMSMFSLLCSVQLSSEFNDPHLQEAVRIVPMRLRVASYSPSPIPIFGDRPTIHVVGETSGSSPSGQVRRVRGTVSVIADGSVRWTLVSCFLCHGMLLVCEDVAIFYPVVYSIMMC